MRIYTCVIYASLFASLLAFGFHYALAGVVLDANNTHSPALMRGFFLCRLAQPNVAPASADFDPPLAFQF